MLKTVRSESFQVCKDQIEELQKESVVAVVSSLYDGSYYCYLVEVTNKEETPNESKEKIEEAEKMMEARDAEIAELKKERAALKTRVTKLENKGE